MSEDLVLRSVEDRVCTLSFNNPGRHNAWTHQMERRYFERLDEAAADDEVRAIVITGTGSTFCPGADTADLARIATDGELVLSGRRSQHYALTIPKPMVAAVNGACAGIGLVQALVCDVRFVAREARLTTAYARLGVAAEYGMSWILPRLIGIERALDLLLSARVFDGEQAQDLGLASRALPADEVLPAAQAYAGELARRCSPRAMAAIRRQVWADLSKGWEEANGDWLDVMRGFNDRRANPDMSEGIAAMIEKRAPDFGPIPPGLRLPDPIALTEQ
jgi:enoyl-CoA hydratase/carnithine racemase